MTIWIRIKLRALKGSNPGSQLESSGLVNSGYAAESPEIVLPLRAAEVLGIWPEMKSQAVEVSGTAFGGIKVEALLIRNCLRLELIAPGIRAQPVDCDAILAPGEPRILLSDQAISALKIILVDVGRGIWRHREDPPRKLRRSEAPEFW